MRNGVSAAKKTAWLGVPMTWRPGASCLENTPLSGSTIAFWLLPLDIAAGVRRRTGLEQADLQRLAFKQCFTADFHGAVPAS